MTYDEFKNKYNGKYVDFDGSYGAQCWDLAQFYITEVLELPSSILSGCGLVSNMLYPPKRADLDKYFDEVPVNLMEQGDIVIWDYGHIAIYDHYNGDNDKCYFFSQNPNPCQVMAINTGGAYAFRKKGQAKHNIGYRAQCEDYGWQNWVYDGNTAGTTGQCKRLEAIQIDYDKPVYAKAHIQGDNGWRDYGKINKDTVIGTVGEYKRLECLCLKGDLEYRVHMQDTGWTCWTYADGTATLGSVGESLRIEAIQIRAREY